MFDDYDVNHSQHLHTIIWLLHISGYSSEVIAKDSNKVRGHDYTLP